MWRLKRKYGRTKVFRESGKGKGKQKIVPGTRVRGRLRKKKQYKMVPGRTNLKNWRLSLKQRSIVDFLGVLEFLNSYSETRNSMQR